MELDSFVFKRAIYLLGKCFVLGRYREEVGGIVVNEVVRCLFYRLIFFRVGIE